MMTEIIRIFDFLRVENLDIVNRVFRQDRDTSAGFHAKPVTIARQRSSSLFIREIGGWSLAHRTILHGSSYSRLRLVWNNPDMMVI